jgi:hypothetical protein
MLGKVWQTKLDRKFQAAVFCSREIIIFAENVKMSGIGTLNYIITRKLKRFPEIFKLKWAQNHSTCVFIQSGATQWYTAKNGLKAYFHKSQNVANVSSFAAEGRKFF